MEGVKACFYKKKRAKCYEDSFHFSLCLVYVLNLVKFSDLLYQKGQGCYEKNSHK